MRQTNISLISLAMSFKILVMGLSGAGKTTLAAKLCKELDASHINADIVREKYNDWDFSGEGRMRQAFRIRDLASSSVAEYVVMDFICPLNECRKVLRADVVIWMDTTCSSKYKDTDGIFEPPIEPSTIIVHSREYSTRGIALIIRNKKSKKEKEWFTAKMPTF